MCEFGARRVFAESFKLMTVNQKEDEHLSSLHCLHEALLSQTQVLSAAGGASHLHISQIP